MVEDKNVLLGMVAATSIVPATWDAKARRELES